MKDFRQAVVKALLPHIVLSLLSTEPMHGYGIICTIRKKHRPAYFGPSTIYPLLIEFEREGLVTSQWNMIGERPRKTYGITGKGRMFLAQTEVTLRAEQIIDKTIVPVEAV
jgi:DNA-binding PadR family transcriptional regulator